MNFNKLFLVPFLAFAITACGNDCKSSCEDSNDCPGVTTKADCDKVCDDLDQLAEDADCSDEWDDLASCGADQDACKADNTACKSESDKYIACLTPYCTKNLEKCA
ncbi:MAG TPA: hypothetical protein VFV94_15555, partial [Polyangiaceae bacterium]|nr:hypothetical protein [Polyangiaceae bacterium]